MLADQASRRAHENTPPPEPSLPGSAPDPVDPGSGVRLPSPSSSAGRPEATVKLPWTPTPPDRAAVQDRPVPAYTVPAPVGPDHSGSVRCAPDGMGGQRCMAP
jgi:hypothetical protein